MKYTSRSYEPTKLFKCIRSLVGKDDKILFSFLTGEEKLSNAQRTEFMDLLKCLKWDYTNDLEFKLARVVCFMLLHMREDTFSDNEQPRLTLALIDRYAKLFDAIHQNSPVLEATGDLIDPSDELDEPRVKLCDETPLYEKAIDDHPDSEVKASSRNATFIKINSFNDPTFINIKHQISRRAMAIHGFILSEGVLQHSPERFLDWGTDGPQLHCGFCNLALSANSIVCELPCAHLFHEACRTQKNLKKSHCPDCLIYNAPYQEEATLF